MAIPTHRLLASFLLPALTTTTATGVLVSTGFEGQTYTSGAPLDGQDGWVGVHGGNAIRVSDTNANHGKQCVEILGSGLVPSGGSPIVEAYGGKFLEYDPVADGRRMVRLKVSASLAGPATGVGIENDLISANFYTATTAGENLGSFFVSSNGRVYGNGGGGQYYLFEAPYTLGTYVDLELVLDFDQRTTTFVVDNQEIGTAPMHPTPLVSTELMAVALEVSAATWGLTPVQRSAYVGRFDDCAVTAAAH